MQIRNHVSLTEKALGSFLVHVDLGRPLVVQAEDQSISEGVSKLHTHHGDIGALRHEDQMNAGGTPHVPKPRRSAACEVVYVLADSPRPALPTIALKHRLPTVYQVSTYPDLGGLMAYGPDIKALLVRAAYYADRIFKGANPAELPIEQPTKFVFVVNLHTARTLEVTIPEQVLLMADRVIE